MPARTGAAGTSFMIPRSHADLVKRRAVDEGLGRRHLRHGRPLARLSQHRADDLGRRRRLLRPARRAIRAATSGTTTTIAATAICSSPMPSSIRRPTARRARISRTTPSLTSASSTRRKDGLIVRGAKMLATHGPTADELLVYPQPGLREGEERYVLAFGIPTATPGLRFICREPFDTGDQSAVGSSARRAFRGARRGLRVRRRADPLGPGLSLQRRQDGQRAVRAGEHPQPHRSPDRDPRPGEMPIA